MISGIAGVVEGELVGIIAGSLAGERLGFEVVSLACEGGIEGSDNSGAVVGGVKDVVGLNDGAEIVGVIDGIVFGFGDLG